jgi:hypothetical protein
VVDVTRPKNAEGYCRKCGQPLGISGQCGYCAITELERKNSEFMRTRTLAYWRGYMRSAVEVLEKLLGRPATFYEKRFLWINWKSNIRSFGSPGSYTALALVTLALDLKSFDSRDGETEWKT